MISSCLFILRIFNNIYLIISLNNLIGPLIRADNLSTWQITSRALNIYIFENSTWHMRPRDRENQNSRLFRMKALCILLAFVGLSVAIPSDFVFPPLKNGGKNWALLVAGSNGWGNYRHQVYFILRKHVGKKRGGQDIITYNVT